MAKYSKKGGKGKMPAFMMKKMKKGDKTKEKGCKKGGSMAMRMKMMHKKGKK